MRASLHLLFAGVLVASTGFFVYIWEQSGWYCGNLGSSCFFSLRYANPQFLSIGILCAFLVAVGSIMAVQQRRLANLPEPTAQRKTRRMGLWLVMLGALLAIYGLYMLNTTTVMCPANGCDSSTLWEIYGPYTASFFGGQFLIVIGAAIVLYSKFMRIKAEASGIEGPGKPSNSLAWPHIIALKSS